MKIGEDHSEISDNCLFQDVLSEIQRLKQEAKRFIAILSQESDDETLSPTKRQSLTREVESLQVSDLSARTLRSFPKAMWGSLGSSWPFVIP